MTTSAPYVLAIDLGTTAVKVCVIDPSGGVVASASDVHTTVYSTDGGAEQDADAWWASIGRCARDAIAKAGPGAAPGVIAVTSQFMSVVAVDRRGLPLAPVIMWTDRRGEMLHPLNERYDVWEQWLDVHGLIPLPADDVAHIYVLRDRYPDHVERLAAYVEPSDAITARLVGHVSATASTAFPLMCTDNRDWNNVGYHDELLAHCGLDRSVLPVIVAAELPLGTVTADTAAHLGVAVTTIVLPATVDSITSAIGCGALTPDRTAFVIGTTAVMATHVASKSNDLGHGLSTIPSPLPGRYFVMAENGMGGKALDLFVNQVVYGEDAFGGGPAPADAYERAARAAASVPPGAGGVQFMPWLVGSIAPAPDDDVRGGFFGVSLATTRAHLARAVYEGVALNAAWLLGPFGDFVGAPVREITIGGGGARADLWAQILADACNVSVHQIEDPAHTNARGAALLALAQLGHINYDDIPAMLRVRRSYEPANASVYPAMLERLQHAHAGVPRS